MTNDEFTHWIHQKPLLNEKNLNELTTDKVTFLKFSKGIEEIFDGPSAYFYLRLIQTLKENTYSSLFSNNSFIEYLYSTLACWGMHRMDKNTRMTDFEKFKNSIIKNKDRFIKLSGEKLREADIRKIKGILLEIYGSLKIMARESSPKFVAHSKIMHFLLPNLVPPMDKNHVLYFLYGGDRITKKGKKAKKIPQIKNDEELFIEVLKQFQKIANRLDLMDSDLKNKWDTSIPKIIDNAIIGYNKSKPN